jgi:hypothetical protein
MKWMTVASILTVAPLSGQAVDLTLGDRDIGLNAYVPKELDGWGKERPKDLPTLDVETVIAWVKAGVALDPEQLKKVEAMKARLRGRMESFRRYVAALQAASEKMQRTRNEREQKRLQEEAKELHERYQKEFASPTANLAYNPLSDLNSWLDAVLSEGQKPVWRAELLKRFGEVASTVSIEKTNKESVTGKLLARRLDYDFGRNREIKSYLVLSGDSVVYVGPTEVAETADHRDAVKITPPGKVDRR